MDVNQCCCDAKLSPNKKSIFGLRTQILSLLFVACFAADVSVAEADVSCAAVRSHFQSKGMLSAVDIQDQPNSGCPLSGKSGKVREKSGKL
ncbi:unnamed protein product [Plutella xylostella]|uniref:(diamondback moth) hypothetical protein n=1 Tax=Plutella xylostella TaxID=51655 RepID=A0A8S4E1R9_PLUXY|nr:unnamed protein product [Plutella xylostella]